MDVEEKTKMKVPFGTMSIPKPAIELINKQLESTMVTNGRIVEAFEDEFARKLGDPYQPSYAVAVSSGTDACTLACASLFYTEKDVKRGISEVIVPALTFISTANAVLNAGLKPVFVDVQRDTLQIDIDKIQDAITENTVAIMPVHLMGKPINMDPLMYIAHENIYKHKRYLPIIEDCAEAHGAEIFGTKVGLRGAMSTFSLYSAHIVSSIEGGMILTQSPQIRDLLKSLRNHGVTMKGSDWEFTRIGFNSKMNELEAAVGLYNTYAFKSTLERRRYNFRYLRGGFERFEPYFYLLHEEEYEKLGPHAFPIIVREDAPFTKQDLVEFYTKHGIDNRNLFYSIPTQTKAYIDMGYKGEFPEAEFCSNNGTHIGIHQDLTKEQLEYIIDKTEEFLMGVV